MRNTVKFTVDCIMADGTYSSDQEPDFAKIEISYIELQRYDPWDFMTYVVKPLIAKLQRWDELHGIKKEEPDLFVSIDEADNASDEAAKAVFTSTETTQPSEDSVTALFRNGEKIEAIRLYRELTGVGLAEAKEAVENLALENGIVESGTTQNTRPSNSQANQPAQNNTSSPGYLFTALIMLGIIFLFGILPQLL